MVLQIARPAPAAGRQAVQYPNRVTVDAQALFQILAHALRRKPGQARVIGTLVGVRNDDGSEVHVKAAYIVPIAETEDEVNVDIEYHREMYQLMRRVYSDSVILGWYATSPVLNNLSALIHDFYSQEQGTYPYPAIHLTLQSTEAADLGVRTYISSPVGVPSELGNVGNCIFLPVASVVNWTDVDRSALGVVGDAASDEERNAYVLPLKDNLDAAVSDLLDQIERVQKFVQTARSSPTPTPEAEAMGRYLYKTLSTAPTLTSSTDQSTLYSTYLRDILAMVRLTESVKSQLQATSEITALV